MRVNTVSRVSSTSIAVVLRYSPRPASYHGHDRCIEMVSDLRKAGSLLYPPLLPRIVPQDPGERFPLSRLGEHKKKCQCEHRRTDYQT